jgi:hypothetical protein
LIESLRFKTDSKGDFEKEFQISKEGEYELEVEARDRKGNLVFITHDSTFMVKGQLKLGQQLIPN